MSDESKLYKYQSFNKSQFGSHGAGLSEVEHLSCSIEVFEVILGVEGHVVTGDRSMELLDVRDS